MSEDFEVRIGGEKVDPAENPEAAMIRKDGEMVDVAAALVCPECDVDAYYFYEKPSPGTVPTAANVVSPGEDIEAVPGADIECWNCGHIFTPGLPDDPANGSLHMGNVRVFDDE